MPKKKPIKKTQMFHGTSKRLKSLKPKKHYLSEESVVFGSPLIEVALTFIAPWNDSEIEMGMVNNEPVHLIELQKNSFKNIFEGKKGWIYMLDPTTFKWRQNLTRFEYISEVAPKILDKVYIRDVLETLRDFEAQGLIQLVHFEDRKDFIKKGYRY